MRTALAIIFIFVFANSYGQNSKRDNEIYEIEKNQDSIPRSVFLDSTLLPNMTVVINNTRQVWSSNSKNDKHIMQLYDIRMRFKDHKAALAFHKKYLRENSEFGEEIFDHSINSTGADEFRVFRGTAALNALSAQMGYQMFCFLFVVDNYFVKIFISCNKTYKPEKFQDIITEAIKRIKNSGS